MVLDGDRVRLRGLVPADEEALLALLGDPDVTGALGLWALRPIGRSDISALLRPSGPSLVRWGVEDRADGALVGMGWLSGVDPRDRHADLHLLLGPRQRWNRGLGTETVRLITAFAFAHLGLLKVSAEVPLPFPAALRAALAAGYTAEGRLVRNRWLDGGLVDVDAVAAFADEAPWSEIPAWT